MRITRNDLVRWMENSIELASISGYDKNILNFIKENTKLTIDPILPTKIGVWFGWYHHDEKEPEIMVCHRNLSTEPIELGISVFRADGMPEETIEQIIKVYNELGRDAIFEIYNQTNMDHEVIGHSYNHFNNTKHDELAACNTQIEFAKVRSKSSKAWKTALQIIPVILAYRKGIDELK